MNEIQNINGENKIVQTISSREVAEMLGKEHWEVLRMLEGYEHLKVVKVEKLLE